jgi:hypothetical protein
MPQVSESSPSFNLRFDCQLAIPILGNPIDPSKYLKVKKLELPIQSKVNELSPKKNSKRPTVVRDKMNASEKQRKILQ